MGPFWVWGSPFPIEMATEALFHYGRWWVNEGIILEMPAF